MDHISIAALLSDCLNSPSEESWNELARRVNIHATRAIWSTLRRCSGDANQLGTVEDLVQQTYIRLCADDFRLLRNLRLVHENSFACYVRAVASSVTIDLLRDHRPPTREVDETTGGVSDNDGERALVFFDIDRHLLECSEADPTRDRNIFWLHYRNGMTTKSISRLPHFKITEKAVESILFRLIRCLRRIFAEGKHGKNSS